MAMARDRGRGFGGVKALLGLPGRAVRLWNYPVQEARVILEQGGDLKYLTVPARLQVFLLRGGMVFGSLVFLVICALMVWGVLLQAGKRELERSHLEIYAALVGSREPSEGGLQTALDKDEMLLLAQAIRDRDLEIRRYVDSATATLHGENGHLSARLEATGLSERAVKAIQSSQPVGGFGPDSGDITDPLLKGQFAAESARNQSLNDVL